MFAQPALLFARGWSSIIGDFTRAMTKRAGIIARRPCGSPAHFGAVAGEKMTDCHLSTHIAHNFEREYVWIIGAKNVYTGRPAERLTCDRMMVVRKVARRKLEH